jgi:hypothetical protein
VTVAGCEQLLGARSRHDEPAVAREAVDDTELSPDVLCAVDDYGHHST